jgi:hypothetical protein
LRPRLARLYDFDAIHSTEASLKARGAWRREPAISTSEPAMMRAKRSSPGCAIGVLPAPGIAPGTGAHRRHRRILGPFADYGAQIVGGMKTYLKLNGDVYGGRRSRSSSAIRPGPAPDIAKRHAQEL